MKRIIILLMLLVFISSCDDDKNNIVDSDRYGHPNHDIKITNTNVRCKAYTRDGNRCNNITNSDCGYCWKHHY